jgi:hypothetical protein
MRIAGAILIIVGILGFIVDNVSFTTNEQVVDVGPVEVERERERSIPITPIAAGGAILVGAGLVVVGTRRQSG